MKQLLENKKHCKQTENFERGIKVYKRLALPSLLYGSEHWIIKARDARRIRATEIKYAEKQQDILRQVIKQTQGLQRN